MAFECGKAGNGECGESVESVCHSRSGARRDVENGLPRFFYGGSPDVPGDGPPRERRTRVYRPAMSVDMQNGVFFFFAFF